jgi:NAD(P)-dependent dehydrogenase (short-subunit alcohol dehydrogenase family)
VLHLASHHARVYLCARTESKAQAAISSIKVSITSAHPGAEVDIRFLHMDLTSLSSVATAAHTFLSQETRLHGLVNNAGIMATAFTITPDGYEEQWQVNYLSHYLLTSMLLPTLLATASAPGSKDGDVRIVDVTSIGHNYSPKAGIDFADINQEKGGVWTRYGQSKLGNILHAKLLNQRLGPRSDAVSKIWTAAVHPGSVDT